MVEVVEYLVVVVAALAPVLRLLLKLLYLAPAEQLILESAVECWLLDLVVAVAIKRTIIQSQ